MTALSAAIADPLLRHRGWTAFWGVTGIAAGVVTFVWPSITAEALLIVIATWSLLIGGSQIVFAVRARKQVSDAWAIALGGALLVLLAVLLVLNPGAGALGITWAIGWFAFLFGIVQLWLASVVRRETHELTTADTHPNVTVRTPSGLTCAPQARPHPPIPRRRPPRPAA